MQSRFATYAPRQLTRRRASSESAEDLDLSGIPTDLRNDFLGMLRKHSSMWDGSL